MFKCTYVLLVYNYSTPAFYLDSSISSPITLYRFLFFG